MSNESKTKEIFKEVMEEVVVDLDSRIKALVQELVEYRSSQLALVTILAEKGILTTDEFDKKVEEIKKVFMDNFAEMTKHGVSKGVQ